MNVFVHYVGKLLFGNEYREYQREYSGSLDNVRPEASIGERLRMVKQ